MNLFKKVAVVACNALLIAGCSSSSTNTGSDSSAGDGPKIGIIQYFEHPALDEATRGFEDYLRENGYEDANFDFNSAQGETANCSSIAQKLVNAKSDLIFAVGTQAALAAANETKDIPVVISAVTNPEGSGLVASNEKPGGNVTGSSDLNPVADQIALIQDLVPEAKTVGLLYCNAESNSAYQIDLAKEACEQLGYETVEATVTESNQIQQVVESLNGKVDVLYVPTDNLLADSMATVAQTATMYKIPTIVGEEGMVKNGGLATYGISYYQIGQLAGKQAVSILNGESQPGDLPIEYVSADDCTLTVNAKTAAQLGLDFPESIQAEAVIVGEED